MGRGSKIQYSGILTCYGCTAECRHCMFCSSPAMPKESMSERAAARICEALARDGVQSVHVGGGEPFLDFESLCTLLCALAQHGIGVDYIETNAFWAKDPAFAQQRLMTLTELGKPAIMVSVDPFHIEYVPLSRPLMLVSLLRKHGFDYFIWQERFLERLAALDHTRTYSHDELKGILGENYVADIAQEYGVKANGRALKIARQIMPLRPAQHHIDTAAPCGSLLAGMHCHVDLYENVIPSGCPGIAIALDDFLADRLPKDRYPVASRLHGQGIAGLYQYAAQKGFHPDPLGYATKCDLCHSMRAYLADASPSQDIAPLYFYTASQ